MPRVSVLIVARDASATIGEAMGSALSEPIDELLLVDDCSSDSTIEVAASFGDSRVRIKKLSEHRTLGYARGVGLSDLNTDLCFLLDADDSFLPGRVERLVGAMENGRHDFVADEISLVDGLSGQWIRDLTIPGFLDKPPGLLRLFERNYLPGIGQIGFRVEAMKRIGYDPEIHGTEDSDLVFRALMAGLRATLVRTVGYRMRHFSNSVSRNRNRQSINLEKSLRKHSLDLVRKRFSETGCREEITDWALYSLAIFQGDLASALSLLERLRGYVEPGEIVEPYGPCPFSERWRLAFAAGTLDLLQGRGRSSSVKQLEDAVYVNRQADALNNLGIAYFDLGREETAMDCFAESLELRPGYMDASENLNSKGTSRCITRHPLRREPSRSEY